MGDIRTIQLKCQDCGGIMNTDEDKQVFLCPYCGSKKILIESDEVKIERMKSQTEIGRQQVELGQQQVELAKQDHEEKMRKRELIEAIIGVFLIMLVLFLLNYLMK